MDDEPDFAAELRGEVFNVTGHGNYVNGNGRVVWWILGIFGVLIASGVMAGGAALYGLKADVAALTAKVDILLSERRPVYRGDHENERRP